LRSHAELKDLVRHDGEEFLFVLSGEVQVITEHHDPIHLVPGDSCYFDSTMGHALLSVSDIDAVVLWVCSRLTQQK
jgi:uncharacterized cupin superfamily protein